MAKVKVKTTHSVMHTITENIDGVDHSFEVGCEPADYLPIHVKISENGKRAVVGYLCRDDDPENPREMHDNVGKMVCWHTGYTLGDEQRTDDASDFWRELAFAVEPELEDRIDRLFRRKGDCPEADASERKWVMGAVDKHYLRLPLFLYDHSGISMSTGSFVGRAQHAEWDSGQVGWIYATREKVLEEWGGGSKRLTPQIKAQALKYLEGEVETYDQYLTGDVWGICYPHYVNVAEEGDPPEWEAYDEEEESHECWGYYGSDWAEKELADGMDYHLKILEAPIPDQDQTEMPFGEGANI